MVRPLKTIPALRRLIRDTARNASIVLACAVVSVQIFGLLVSHAATFENHPALPPGMPLLPLIGERMSTDDLSGFAIRGFDPVSYFINGKPAPGVAAYEYNWAGTVWRFSTEAKQSCLWQPAPLCMLRSLMGIDAIAIAEGRIVEADLFTFAIVDGRLFFFRTDQRRKTFLDDTDLAVRSLAAWPKTSLQLSR